MLTLCEINRNGFDLSDKSLAKYFKKTLKKVRSGGKDEPTGRDPRSSTTSHEDTAGKSALAPAAWRDIPTRTDNHVAYIAKLSDVNLDQLTGLLSAALNGNLEEVRRILNDGAPVDVTSTQGHTALHLSVLMGHPHIAELLLERGADITREIS